MRHVSFTFGLLLVAGAVSAAGCASGALVNQRTQTSMAAIRAAEEVGVSKAPRASLHLELAKEAVARAGVLSKAGKKDEAASYLSRAEADAELAVLLSREESEKVEASKAMERVRKLQQENM